jgi:hypothetical protein
MNIFSYKQIGESHANYCEDDLFIGDVGKNKIVIAVMDGCTMGIDSHFASTLLAKSLKRIVKEMYFKDFIEKNNKDLHLKDILAELFKQINLVKKILHLEKQEVLSTIILGIIDTNEKKAELICIGDGLIICNGNISEFEQGNIPDYLGYHLEEDFEEWYLKQGQQLSFEHVKDISISTDGIFTFKDFDKYDFSEKRSKEIISLLLIDNVESNETNYLKKKIGFIENHWKLRPIDDIGIIRILL